MTSKTSKIIGAAAGLILALLAPRLVLAQAVTNLNDNFTGASDSSGWMPIDGACLTAGDGTGTIPACVGASYYASQGQAWVGGNSGSLPDPSGLGALRLTNGCTGSGCGNGTFKYGYHQAGGIISPLVTAGNGLQITFKTFTYEGNSGGNGQSGAANGHDGADGISFFILDGTVTPPGGTAGEPPYNNNTQFDVGAFGGSLGYTCTDETGNDDNNPHPGSTLLREFDGVYAGFLAVGIDEYGNFLNAGDNTASGPGQYANRIALRGSGNVNWTWLNSKYPTLFKSSWLGVAANNGVSCGPLTPCTESGLAVRNTCASGYLEDYSGNKLKLNGATIPIPDYPAVTNGAKILPSPIANESATKRSQAVPITYRLKITQDGILSLAYSYNGQSFSNVLSPQTIQSLIGSPLPSTVRFGFAGSTGGSTNIHEIACFEAGPPASADTSVGVNQKEASKIATGTQAFLAYYSPDTWTGDVTANGIGVVNGVVQVASLANWDAACNLNGVASNSSCLATGVAGPITAQSASSRVMLTWNGTQGIPFEWGSLTTPEQNTIDAGDTTPFTANRVNYLRGDRTNEIDTSGNGLFRRRTSVLGDVVDSSPTWVGYPDSPYSLVWQDRLYPSSAPPENGTNTYAAFVSTYQKRLNVVYVGANDGFVHGFRAGSYDANHNFVGTLNDGQEVLAYMPAAVQQTIHNSTDPTLDYSNTQYGHNFYVDATPDEDDLYYANGWHTWLVGGLGAGGSAIYALDVTDPSTFSESNASSTVIGEWNPAAITAAGCPGVSGNCGDNLGNTFGTPVIRRLHNGMWGVIFGNGYGSTTGDAGIYIMTIDPTSGAKTFYYLSAGQAGTNDGIAYPSPADLDGDDVIDYVYAGDLNGNVWRFDLTSSSASGWHVTAGGPLFSYPGHPISTRVTVGATLVSQGTPRVMVDFGTGRKVPLTNSTPDTYATGQQGIYGVWDWNMGSWNAQSQVHYATLASGPTGNVLATSLEQQTLTNSSVTGVLDDTNNAICWADDTVNCASNPQYGWFINLPGSGEQVIFNPLLYQGTLYVNTTIPPDPSPLDCSPPVETGNTIAISATTGSYVKGLFPNYTDTTAAGEKDDPSGSPFVVLVNGGAYVLTQSTLGMHNETPPAGPLTCTAGNTMVCEAQVAYHGISAKRLTWIEKR